MVVVHHDDTLERTTDGRGPIHSRTAQQLAELDAGFHFTDGNGAYPFRGQGFGVPTLREVLTRYPSALLIVELKQGGRRLAERVVDDLRAANALGRAAVGSFHPDALRTVREIEPALPTGATKEETRWALYRSWAGIRIAAAGYREFQVPVWSGMTPIVTRRFVRAAHRAGVAVKVWTVNDPVQMRQLLAIGVDALITDRPDLAREVLARWRGTAASGG
jgi:glycerophosphoryl diester phosphodiesterase